VKCEAIVRWGSNGKLARPRPCARNARGASPYCHVHARLAGKPKVESFDGGWCVWCVGPGRRYQTSGDGTPITLCNAHAVALANEIKACVFGRE